MLTNGTVLEAFSARRRLNASPSIPHRISLKITSHCNLSCAFCEIGSQQSGVELPFTTIEPLLRFASKERVRVFLCGGEPFLHRRVWDLFALCEALSLKVSLVTNGTTLSRLSDDRQALLNNCIAMMSLSIDAPTPEDHDAIRGNGSYKKAVTYLTRPDRRHGLGLNTVLAVDFANALPMIEFAHKHRVSINFQPLRFETNFPDLPRAEWKNDLPRQMAELADHIPILEAAEVAARRLNVTSNLRLILFYIRSYYEAAATSDYFFDRLLPQFSCFTPSNSLFLDEKGSMMHCSLVDGTGNTVGNDWLAKWREQARQFTQEWASGSRYPACRSCSCHFAENLRCNVLTHPVLNRRQLPWFTRYYLERLARGEGRTQ